MPQSEIALEYLIDLDTISKKKEYYKTFIYKVLCKLIGYTICFVHIIFNIIIIFLPFITNNVYVLLTLIIINVIILTQWILFDGCLLNKLENCFLTREKSTYSNGNEQSIITYFLLLFFSEESISLTYNLIPLIISLYSFIKIIYIVKDVLPFQQIVYLEYPIV